MDAKKFGNFLAEIRKERGMTQAELAKKLAVTDKAVSKWERGLGFPDIHSLEPLADALDISLFELMRSEKNTEVVITDESASAAVEDALGLLKDRRRQERMAVLRIVLTLVCIYAIYSWVERMGIEGFVMIDIPLICLYGGVIVLLYGIWRLIRRQTCMQTFLIAAGMLLVGFAPLLLLLYAFCHGIGPIPS